MIDAGLHPKKVGYEATPDFSLIEDYSLDFILLTHCHLDHVGSLPIIAERNPNARVLTTAPSQILLPRILKNSYNVMKRQRDELGVKEYPLYSRTQIDALEARAMAMPFGKGRVFEDRDEPIEITFHQAGHVVGASGCSIQYKHQTIFITGDVLFDSQRTLPGARFPEKECDVLIMETTRGCVERAADYSRADEVERLLERINHTIEQGGSVLIPTFALGRMQEILALLYDADKKGNLVDAPILCSGLGMSLVDAFDEIARKTNLVQFRRKILHELKVKPLKKIPKPGSPPPEPTIYLISSGMVVENTPSYKTAAAILGDPHSSICFVGYCDPETPGGKLLEAHQGDSFFFEALDHSAPVRAHIERFDLSGHADRLELLNFAQKVDPRTIVLTHGDPEARNWFFDELLDYSPKTIIIDPVPGESTEL